MFQVIDSFLIFLDLQPRIIKALPGQKRLLERIFSLAEGARHLKVSTIGTEQIPEKLGPTLEELCPFFLKTFSKVHFSAAKAEGLVSFLQENGCRSIILAGIETHICIQQTAMELADLGFRVGVLADATTAGALEDHEIALRRMPLKGIEILTVETILMEWTQSSQNHAFREISSLLKAQRLRDTAKDTTVSGTSP